MHFDIFAILGLGGIEAAVESHDAGDVRAAAGEFKDGRAAETIADGGDVFGVGEFIFFQDVKAGFGAFTQERAVGFVFACLLAGFLGILRANAFAVNIGGEDDVAHLCEHFGAPFFVFGEAPSIGGR